MAWIKADESLEKHPKILEFMQISGWDLDKTLSKIQRFWWWCQKYAEDGDLRKHNFSRIGLGVGIENEEESRKFYENLKKVGWIDKRPYLRVHDWWEHSGPWLIAKYKRTPEKWQRIRDLYGIDVTVTEQLRNGDVTVTEQLRNSDVTAKRREDREDRGEGGEGVDAPQGFIKPTAEEATVYAQTIKCVEVQEFLNHYDSNGWNVGKVPMQDWKAAMRNWKSKQGQFSKGGAKVSTLADELEKKAKIDKIKAKGLSTCHHVPVEIRTTAENPKPHGICPACNVTQAWFKPADPKILKLIQNAMKEKKP